VRREASKNSPLFELARVLVRFDHIAGASSQRTVSELLFSSPDEFPMQRSPADSFSGFSIDPLENARALFYRWSRLRPLISQGCGPTAEKSQEISFLTLLRVIEILRLRQVR
jgi:hypothetical protein